METYSSLRYRFNQHVYGLLLNPFKAFWRQTRIGVGGAIVLAFLLIALYHSALTGWWRWDDTQILKLAFLYSPGQYFFVPEAYHGLSLRNFTPWVIFSFDLDLRLFGMHPLSFYIHQLIMIGLAAWGTFILLRLWMPALWAGLCSGLCLIGAPVATIAQQLMTRHYIAGLVFSLFALYLYIRAVREERVTLSLCAALLYLMAMSAKEVYVPLVMVCLFWPENNFHKRLTASAPFFISLTAYLLWRHYMLGAVGGGYPLEWTAILYVPVHVGKALFGTHWTALVVGILSAFILVAGVYRNSLTTLLFSLVLMASVLGPLIPLGGAVTAGRYLLVVWWSLCMVLCTILGRWDWKWAQHPLIPYVLLGLIALTVLINFHRVNHGLHPMAKRFDAVGQFVWEIDNGKQVLYAPRISLFGHYFGGLLWLKQRLGKPSPPVVIMGDEMELASLRESRNTVWAYSAQDNRVRNISFTIDDLLKRWENRLRVKPLRIKLRYGSDQVVHWQCGPYQKGRYTFISCDKPAHVSCKSCKDQGMSKFPLSPAGQWRVNLRHTLCFYLRYDSPEGWTTYSPLLRFNPGGRAPVVWSRQQDIEGPP